MATRTRSITRRILTVLFVASGTAFMAGLAAAFLLWGLNRDPDSLGTGGPPPWLSPETLGAMGTIAGLAKLILGRLPEGPQQRPVSSVVPPPRPDARPPSRTDTEVDQVQQWIDAYIRSTAMQTTMAFRTSLERLEPRCLVSLAEYSIAREILGASSCGVERTGSISCDERYHGFASLFLVRAESRGLLSPQDVLGVRRWEALAVDLAEDETRDLETKDVAALEEAIGEGALKASAIRFFGGHTGVAPGSTTERLRRVACHLLSAAVTARCRSGVYVGLMDLGFEVWMDRPESDREEDLARYREDDAALYEVWRDLGRVVLLTQSEAEQRQALARWVAVYGQFTLP